MNTVPDGARGGLPCSSSASLRVVTVCGQVRPADLDRLSSHYPGILTARGNAEVDVLVTTQSLEVGADLDLAGIVTELASGSALAQRAGRVNRLGKRPERTGDRHHPADGPADGQDAIRPLFHGGAQRRPRLGDRASQLMPLGLAPWAIGSHRRRRRTPRRRLLYQRPELADAWHWARTSDGLAADPELDLWLSDSFEDDTSVGMAVRDALPDNPADAIEFVRDLPPVPREAFSVPFRYAPGPSSGNCSMPGTSWSGCAAASSRPCALRPHGNPDIRPGDTVVIDSSAETFTHVTDRSFSPPVAAPR